MKLKLALPVLAALLFTDIAQADAVSSVSVPTLGAKRRRRHAPNMGIKGGNDETSGHSGAISAGIRAGWSS
jgi:hypothetical protein